MKAAAIIIALLLAGCANQAATPAVKTQTAIAGTEVALTAAEKLATVYVRLPLCRSGGPVACSSASVSSKIKLADNDAVAAVNAARASNSEPDLAMANAAVAALVALVPLTGK